VRVSLRRRSCWERAAVLVAVAMVAKPRPSPLRGLFQRIFPVEGSRQKISPLVVAKRSVSSRVRLTKSQPLRGVRQSSRPVLRSRERTVPLRAIKMGSGIRGMGAPVCVWVF
jgi:hypothetical protein